MNLFTIGAVLRMDTSQFEKSLKKANSEGKGLGEAIGNTFGKIGKLAKTVVTADLVRQTASAMLGLANSTAEAGDRIDKQSQVLGISRKAYQEWDYILSQNGASIDSMSTSMKTLNSAIQDGSDDSKSALLSLGLSYKTLALMTPEEQFEAVVQAFQKMPAGMLKTNLATKLLGKNGQDLLPLLNQTSESTEELRQRAHDLGLVMSDEAVDASVEYGDAMDDLKKTLNGFKYAMGLQILPMLTRGITRITNYAAKLRKAYDAEGFNGVWKTLVEDFKNIEWPSWDDVKEFVIEKWNGIKEGVAGLAKLVFGENNEGEVNWPDWAAIEQFAKDKWEWLRGVAKNVGKEVGGLVFGTKEDGSVAWPDWSDIVAKAKEYWGLLVDTVSKLSETRGALIFGRKEDGSVDWPTWETVKTKAEEIWGEIKEEAAKLTGLVFGDAKDAGSIFESIKETWNELYDTITGKAIEIGTYFFGEENGETVAQWIHGIGDALGVVGAAILGYKLTTSLTTVFNTVKKLLSFNVSTNSIALVIGAVAAAFTLIVENWETIEPILVQIGDYINQYVIQPIETAIKWVRDGIQAIGEFFGLDIFGDKKKRSGEAIYQQMQESGMGYADYVAQHYGTGAKATAAASLAATAEEWEKAGKMNDETYENLYKALAQAQEEAGIASEKILEVDTAIAGIPSDVTTTIHVVTDTSGYTTINGMPDPMGVFSHAKGDWNVPYDNYPALLHRNEMVLTASQARQYREGNNVNLGNIIPSIVSAIREGMAGAQVNAYMDGRKVTKEVSQNIANDYKATRFAT